MFVILKSVRNNYGVKMRLGHSLAKKNTGFFNFPGALDKKDSLSW